MKKKNLMLQFPHSTVPAVWSRITQAAATIRGVTWDVPSYTAPAGSAGLIQAAVYDAADGALLGESGIRDMPPGGAVVSMPVVPIVWGGGELIVTVWCSITSSQLTQYYRTTFPAVSAEPLTVTTTGGRGTLALVTHADYTTPEGWWHELLDVLWLGADATTGDAWGHDWVTGKIVVSANAGTAGEGECTWEQKMAYPTVAEGEALYSLEVDRTSTPCLIGLTSDCRILVSSDLTASATWSDVTSEDLAAVAKALPWNMAIWQGKVWAAEYTAAPNELADGPRIYSCPLVALADDAWTLSLFVDNARHCHGMHVDATGDALYAVFGDATYDKIGIWRLAAADIANGPGDGDTGSDDGWSYVAPSGGYSAGEGRPSLYPINVIAVRGATGVADLLMGSGDQPRWHVTSTPLGGIGAGTQFAVGQHFEAPANGQANEIASNIVVDDAKYLYWFSQATTDETLYASPPPYVHAHRLMEDADDLIIRPIYLPTWTAILNAKQRFATVTLV